MNVSREIKKEEAIKRMRAMHIIPDAINQFENDDTSTSPRWLGTNPCIIWK